MNRRSFIKGLMALASAPAIGKYVNVFKTEGAREGIEQVASKGVDFFNSVIKKVMDEGTLIKEEDRIKTFTHPERSDVMVDVNMGDGTTSVYFDTDEGTRAMGQIGKTADETTKGRTVEELYEAEEIYGPYGKEEQEGIAGGISNLEKFVKKKYAAGGRVGFRSGGIGRLMSEGIKTALKRTRKGYDTPGADFQVLTQSDSYLMSPPNMQMLEKLKIIRRQLVRDIKRKEGGGKYTFGPDPKATKKDLQSLDEYIAELMKKIGVEGYYGEGRAAEKALLESDPSLPFSKLVKDRYRSADGGRVGFKSGKFVKDGIAALLKLGKGQLKTADEIEPSEFSKFNERNRKLTDEEYEDLVAEYGEGVPQLETVADAERFVQGQKDYQAAMFRDYKAGKLDPKPGEPGRKRYLEKKAEEAEMSGDSRLFTPDEADELTSMQKFGGPKTDDYYRQSLQIEVNKLPIEELTPEALKVKFPGMPDEMAQMVGNDTNLQRKAEAIAAIEQAFGLKDAGKSADEIIEILKREPETKMADGGPVTEDVSLTVIKIPDISQSGVESLFKRR